MMKTNHSRLKRQFELLIAKLKHALAIGKWNRLSPEVRAKAVSRLQKLLSRLKRAQGAGYFEKALAGLMGLLIFNTAKGQNLSFVQTNPFGIAPPTNHVCPSFVDLDGDGDYDLYIAGSPRNGYFQENIGTATAPAFGPVQTNAFGIGPYYGDYNSADFADLDGDGDFDLMEITYSGEILFFENVGSATAPAFAPPVLYPFGTVTVSPANYSYYFAGELVDIDADGDFDLVLGGYDYGTYQDEFHFFQNIGTPTAPNFAAPVTQPFGGARPVGAYPAMTFSDVDCDGDLDMLSGNDHSGDIFFYENVSGTLPPTFALPVQLGFGFVPAASGVATSEFVDIDGDGVLELFVGTEYNNVRFFERVCTVLPVEMGALHAELRADGQVFLDWETHSEINNAHFLVERSANLNAWETVLQVNGAGNSSQTITYSGVDPRPLPGDSHYRLKQVDANGESQTGPAVRVSGVPAFFQPEVFPNPSTGLVAVSGLQNPPLESIELYNALQQRFEVQVVAREAHAIEFDLSSLPPGMYFLRIEQQVLRIVKQGL